MPNTIEDRSTKGSRSKHKGSPKGYKSPEALEILPVMAYRIDEIGFIENNPIYPAT